MVWNRRTWTALAALSGLIGVAAGAFAAHGVTAPAAKELVRTGANYELFHALAVLACSALAATGAPRARWAAGLFLGGTILFCGSLYALAAGAPRLVGAITPFGGLAFLAGWLALAWAALDIDATGRRP
jgi:uncharacterized membrane protein YgdD (TMEM256/DUF423 family)